MPSLPVLTSDQIDQEFHSIKGYIGALPKDELAQVPPHSPSFAVVNNENHTGKGSHWVCFYSGPTQPAIVCFDSMGAPPNQSIVAYCQRLQQLTGKPVTYSTKQIQELGTSSCGWFCIYILQQLLAGKSFQSILHEFSNVPSQNEQTLYRKFQHYHNSSLPIPSSSSSSPQKGKGLLSQNMRRKSQKVQRLQNFQITPSASAGVKLKKGSRRTPLKYKQKLPLERNPLGLLTNNVIRLPREHRVPPPFNPLGLITNNNVRVSQYIPTPSS